MYNDNIRPCTLLVGRFELKISKFEAEPYFATCEKVGFTSAEHDSIYEVLKDFKKFQELWDEYIVRAIVYKGYILPLNIVERTWTNTIVSVCKEINFNCSSHLSELLRSFPEAVDEYLEREISTVKNQFSVVVDGYTLEVYQYNVYQGKCEAIGFISEGSPSLDDLVSLFRQRVNEVNNSVKIEYRGYELIITREQVNNAWFVGKSTLREDWLVASATKEYVEKCHRQDVDEKLEREKVIATVEEARKGILSYQLDLEAFLERRGYLIRIADNGVCSYGRYAIHPDYYEQWRDETDDDFPDWVVIRIW